MEEVDDYKDPITRLDITLHDKSHDQTDAKIKIDDNLYGGDERSQNEINPEFSNVDLTHHGKSYDFMPEDSKELCIQT